MKRIILPLTLILIIILAFVPAIPSSAESNAPDSYSVGAHARYLLTGETYDIVLLTKPEGASFPAVEYTSENFDIARVDVNGTVTGVSQGKATITIAPAGMPAQTTDIYVVDSMVNINAVAIPMKPGGKFLIYPKVSGKTKASEVTYASSNEEVAKVSKNGTITAVTDGRVKITATTGDGAHSRYMWVGVDSNITALGIDISVWQGELTAQNWQTIKDFGYTFVIIRAGYGREIEQKDKQFESYYETARAAGMELGAYHYSHALTPKQAELEAETMLKWLEGKTFEYPICYDVEEAQQMELPPAELAKIIDAYCEKLEAEGYKDKVIIYSFANMLQKNMPRSELAKREIWLAHTRTLQPRRTYTGHYSIWQFSHSGRFPGIYADFDLNAKYN